MMKILFAILMVASMAVIANDEPFHAALVGASLMDCPSYCDGAPGTATTLSGLFAIGGNNLTYRAAAGDLADDLLRESEEMLSRYFFPGMNMPDFFIWSDTGQGVYDPAGYINAMRAAFNEWKINSPSTQLVVIAMPPADGVIDWFWEEHSRSVYERGLLETRKVAAQYNALVIDAWEGWESSGEQHPYYPGGDYHPSARSRKVAANRIYAALLEAAK